MILYNVTIGLDQSTEAEWLVWMKAKHIPDMMNTGLFTGYKIYKVLSQEDKGTVSYSVQYLSNSMEQFMEYLEKHAKALTEEHHQRYRERYVAFRTLLEEV